MASEENLMEHGPPTNNSPTDNSPPPTNSNPPPPNSNPRTNNPPPTNSNPDSDTPPKKKMPKRGKRGGANINQQLAFRMLNVLDKVIQVICNKICNYYGTYVFFFPVFSHHALRNRRRKSKRL